MSCMKIDHTDRGFINIELRDKYNQPYTIRQSSADLSDTWLIIPTEGQLGMKIGNNGILIDDKTWKELKKARRLIRRK